MSRTQLNACCTLSHLSAGLAINTLRVNDSIYQKTTGLNDFYLSDGRGGPPLGNVQLLGKVSGAILKSELRRMPEAALNLLTRRTFDFLFMSEDLPSPESRVRLDGSRGARLAALQYGGAECAQSTGRSLSDF
jgi:hypothetical protein